MFAIIVCAAVLMVIGYFAALCSTEVAWWLRGRIQSDKRQSAQPHALSHRQIVTR